uniref:Uncharacterized protein n=1 Tax=Rhizophora mucronata TaxID=61149 RepID=A0A2P2PVU6_RHIMU
MNHHQLLYAAENKDYESPQHAQNCLHPLLIVPMPSMLHIS